MQTVSENSYKKTLIVIAIGFAIIFLVLKIKWAILVTALVGIVGFASPVIGRIIEKYWLLLAKFMGIITSSILLFLIYFLILSPLAWLSRLGKKDPLMLTRKEGSLFVDVHKNFPMESFKKTW